MKYKTIIEHWNYHDGWRDIPEPLKKIYKNEIRHFDKDIVGWHCWVYPEDDNEFVTWMENNMTGSYECDYRFNSGDPMFTVHIREDEDATLFKIRWM